MTSHSIRRFIACIGLGLAASLSLAAGPAAVNAQRMAAAEQDGSNWPSYGRTYGEQRFSPLEQINAGNVAGLGLAWTQTLQHQRGVEATPLVVDGVLYISGAWNVVYAFDAENGKPLWTFDPKVDRKIAGRSCCGPVSRGVAVWEGKVFAATLDGRLIALNARNGRPLWTTQTFVDTERPYTITGAPRVVKGKVLIGNGGAEHGVRGYVSAYDTKSGKLAWRFFTVPGDPSKPFENKAMAMAAKTWSGDQWWTWGGGGTVWDAMSYDPELDLLYIGVGNGATWPRALRSPNGGDNLFLSSIVALKPSTGEYVWHYQLAPGEQWDYPATAQIVLADVQLGGQTRKVLMQVPKHGFVYVVDRTNGRLLSAEKFTKVTWASGYDLQTGRPIENPEADYSRSGKSTLVYPGYIGGHNWNPVAYSPRTGYLYFGELQNPGLYTLNPSATYRMRNQRYNTGQDMGGFLRHPELSAEIQKNTRGSLIAWDVAAGKVAWQVEQTFPANGGALATAGNLVFYGTAAGQLVAYAADSGQQLWAYNTHAGIPGGPISYSVKGKQYIAVGIGWGGGIASAFPDAGALKGLTNVSRIAVFALDGKATLPAPPPVALNPGPPALTAEGMQRIPKGAELYFQHCGYCHGDGAGGIPSLPAMTARRHEEFIGIVLGGLLQEKGMPSFAEQLTIDETLMIQDFVTLMAHQRAAQAAQQAKPGTESSPAPK